ncbi:MAG: phosphotransferase enzyme family protein [Candidatus Rifleibacteriota bacterium]
MKQQQYLERWTKRIKENLDPIYEYEVLSYRQNAITLMVNEKSIIRLIDIDFDDIEQLMFEWNLLKKYSAKPGFPSQKPIRILDLTANIKGIELSYVKGEHPKVESRKDYYQYGQTLANFHKHTIGKASNNMPQWNAHRVTQHFQNPELKKLFTEQELATVQVTIEESVPVFEEYWNVGEWTGIIHSDTHRNNVIIGTENNCLIDFAECGKGIVFWDLGVAICDTGMDFPNYALQCETELVKGYISELPASKKEIENNISVFSNMRALEIMSWPVSDWTNDYRLTNQDKARKVIEASLNYLEWRKRKKQR